MDCPKLTTSGHVDLETNLRELAVFLPVGRRNRLIRIDVREPLVLAEHLFRDGGSLPRGRDRGAAQKA